jgi:hypothetical protein
VPRTTAFRGGLGVSFFCGREAWDREAIAQAASYNSVGLTRLTVGLFLQPDLDGKPRGSELSARFSRVSRVLL